MQVLTSFRSNNWVCNIFRIKQTSTSFKIKIPLSLPSIMMGVNQVIMMALASCIGLFHWCRGNWRPVWLVIRNLDVGWAMEGGLCILFMAIMFDRFSMSLVRSLRDFLPMFKNFSYYLKVGKNTLLLNLEKPLSYSHFVINLFVKKLRI